MALADVIQEIEDARVDAQSLEDFIFQPAGVMVERRLAPPVNTLQYYVDYMSDLVTGKDGADGINATIESLTVATGAAGTAASVVTGGTPTARTFALTIPRGDKGLDGSFTQKSYTTYALMDADKVNIPANTSVTVTNDTDTTKNGMYAYNGTVFTKSAYDPLTQSKTYTDTAKSSAISTAASDATTKANTAKSEAITASKTYTDSLATADVNNYLINLKSISGPMDAKTRGIKVGEYYYAKEYRSIFKVTALSTTDGAVSGSSYIPFKTNGVYIYEGELYVFDGADLVPSGEHSLSLVMKLKSIDSLTDAIFNNGSVTGDYFFSSAQKTIQQVAEGNTSIAVDVDLNMKFIYKDKIYTLENGQLLRVLENTDTVVQPIFSVTNQTAAISNGAVIGDIYYNENAKRLYKLITASTAEFYPFSRVTKYVLNGVWYEFNGASLVPVATAITTQAIKAVGAIADAIASAMVLQDVFYNIPDKSFYRYTSEPVGGLANATLANNFTKVTTFDLTTTFFRLGADWYSVKSGLLVKNRSSNYYNVVNLVSVTSQTDAKTRGVVVGDIYFDSLNTQLKTKQITAINDTGFTTTDYPMLSNDLYLFNGNLYIIKQATGEARSLKRVAQLSLNSYTTPASNTLAKPNVGIDETARLAEPTPQAVMSSYANGLKFTKELAAPLSTLTKTGDKYGHTMSFVIHNDICYSIFMVNYLTKEESPPELNIRLHSFPLNDPTNITYTNISNLNDVFLGKTVVKNFDSVIYNQNGILHMLWNVEFSGEGYYSVLHQTFDTATSTLSAVQLAKFKVKSTTKDLTKIGVNEAIAAEKIRGLEPLDLHIILMSRITSRVEGGITYYYTSIGTNSTFNIIVKTKDFVTWEYVSHPSFPNLGQYEPTAYVLDTVIYYYCRQKHDSAFGFLTKYYIQTGTWDEPIYIPDCQSRPEFFYHLGGLYLVSAPKDRYHISIIKIDTRAIEESFTVQVARNAGMFAYPVVESYNGKLYMLYSDNKVTVHISEFTLASIPHHQIDTAFKTLLNI